MLRRYRKIKGDSRLTATGDRGHHSVCNYHAARLLSSNSLYLLLTPFIYRASEKRFFYHVENSYLCNRFKISME